MGNFNETLKECAKIYSGILTSKRYAKSITKRENLSKEDLKHLRKFLYSMEEGAYQMLIRFFGQDLEVSEALDILIKTQATKELDYREANKNGNMANI